jgi:hypothetical protein
MIREILKMGGPRLPRVARPIEDLHAPELKAIIADAGPPPASGSPRRRSASTCV